MSLRTLYNVVSPIPPGRFPQILSEHLEPLGVSAADPVAREDGSTLVRLVRADPEMHLGVWIAPLEEGRFQPPSFDADVDAAWVSSVRTVCRIGARESNTPSFVVHVALSLAACLAEEGRIYDRHAQRAYTDAEAREIASSEFDIRNYVRYHYLAPPSGEAEHSWLHLHGMAKFFRPELEAFDVHPEVSHKALALLMHLAAESALGAELPIGTPQPYGHGSYRLRPSEEARRGLAHFSPEDFGEEHATPALVVEDAGPLCSLDRLLRGAYELEPKTREELEAEQRVWQARIGAIEAACRESPGEIVVRAALEVGPSKAIEHIWATPTSWSDGTITGELLNDAYADPGLVRGTSVTFDQSRVSGVTSTRDGVALDEVATLRRIDAEAAAALDRALHPNEKALRVQEKPAPDGSVTAFFEDDGVVGALHLRSTLDGRPLGAPTWLYNRRETPPVLDERRLEELGRPPLLSEVYTNQREAAEAPAAQVVSLEWVERVVTLAIDGEVWAVGDAERGVGWSRLITLPCRFGRPLSEMRDRPESPAPDDASNERSAP